MDFYFDQIDLGIVRFARKRRWDLISGMRHTHRLPRREKGLEGVIASVTRPETQAWLEELGVPVVNVLATRTPGGERWPAVLSDYYGMGRAGARHLRERGLQRLVFYQMAHGEDSDAILRGFADGAAEAEQPWRHINFDMKWAGSAAQPTPTRDERIHWLQGQLAGLPVPFGIMSEDDRFAQDVLVACEILGLRVPEDVAVIGCDNTPLGTEAAWVPLSSVDAGYCQVGQAAARLLEVLMEGGEVPHRTTVPSPGLVIRKSTSVFYSADAPFAEARNFIAGHFRDPLRVEQIARHSGLSVAALQRRMREEAGTTVAGEIHRLRLDEAARLLAGSTLKLDSIAAECGFVTGRRLCTVFRKAYHTTPAAWREAHWQA